MNILFIGAHPDDIELGCGGLIVKIGNRHKIVWFVLTAGEYPTDIRRPRLDEQLEAITSLPFKVEYIQSTLDDNNLHKYQNALRDRIEDNIKAYDIDTIFTHSATDIHHDHKAVYQATIEAGRSVPNILCYEEAITPDFNPNLYIEIPIDAKLRLLSYHKSQQHRPSLLPDGVKSLALYRGLNFYRRDIRSLAYCEGFKIIRIGEDFTLV